MPNKMNKLYGESAEDEATLVFEEDAPASSGWPRLARRLRRIVARMLPVLLLTGILLAVSEQPELSRWFSSRSMANARVPITVVCDVPWAVIRVDGRGAATRCKPDVAGALPMARLSVAGGVHTLVATAEGFAPYSIYVVAHPGIPGLYLTQFALSPDGAAQALAAVNDYFASVATQEIIFPASFWREFGLRASPGGSPLLVRERFEAVALDSFEPFYSETTYQRPIAPEPGMIGVAAVVVEHVTISAFPDGCDAAPLLERRMPVMYTARASVTFSERPGAPRWTAINPYLLNPAAEIFTPPDTAAAPAAAGDLLAMAARTELAARLDKPSALTDAFTSTPLASSSMWAAGVVLQFPAGALQSRGAAGNQPDLAWLYTGGALLALNPGAHALAPNLPYLPAIAPGLSLDDLRASLTSQQPRHCH